MGLKCLGDPVRDDNQPADWNGVAVKAFQKLSSLGEAKHIPVIICCILTFCPEDGDIPVPQKRLVSSYRTTLHDIPQDSKIHIQKLLLLFF
jgi:hypothetical protein